MLKEETSYLISGLIDEQVVRSQEPPFAYKENSCSKWKAPVAEAIPSFVNINTPPLKKSQTLPYRF